MQKVRPQFKKRPRWGTTFIRQWREFSGLSLDRLESRLGEHPENPGRPFLSKTSISRIELGKQPYSQRILERIADALNCTPADLLMRNPLDKDAPWDIYEAVRGLPSDKQNDIAAMVKAIPIGSKTGTDN